MPQRRRLNFTDPGNPGAGNASIRARRGLLFAKAEMEIGPSQVSGINLRNTKGNLTEFQARFARRNAILAQQLADISVETLRESIIRPGGSGDLERALVDSRNQFSSRFGFGVGRITFLNRSDAKYWRTIEQGTSQFVGKPLVGVWQGGGQFYGFNRERKRDIFIPFRRASLAADFLRARQRRGRDGKFQPVENAARIYGIIKRPITPHRYLARAWDRFGAEAKVREALIEALREAGIIRR